MLFELTVDAGDRIKGVVAEAIRIAKRFHQLKSRSLRGDRVLIHSINESDSRRKTGVAIAVQHDTSVDEVLEFRQLLLQYAVEKDRKATFSPSADEAFIKVIDLALQKANTEDEEVVFYFGDLLTLRVTKDSSKEELLRLVELASTPLLFKDFFEG